MRICTNEEMRRLDSLTIEKYGIPGEILMEHAGRWVALVAHNILKDIDGKSAVVISGRGNNGGDGFVCARYLKKFFNYDVGVILVGEPEALKGDALLNFNRLAEVGIECKKFDGHLPDGDIYIDAILGTGISGAPRGDIADAIREVERHRLNGIPIVSVDIPSGVDGNNGSVKGVSVSADATVTFAFPKIGQILQPGRSKTGELFVVDIGIDSRAEAEVPITAEVATLPDISLLFPERPPDGHKGTFGRGLIIAASAGMTGAAALAGISFLRSGAGLCYAAVPRSLVDIVDGAAREVVVLTMPEVRKRRCHTLRALGELHKYAKIVNAIAIGPGIGRHNETAEMVRRFLTKIQTPVVIDADALNALAGHLDDTIPQITAPSIMTPHHGELARLLGMKTEEVAENRFENAAEWAKQLFTTLVIKGNPTIIAGENNPVWLNPTGNDGMATAGSGDVLTGLIAGFMAQGLSPIDAARIGTYIHGLAGDIAAENLTKRAMLAGDIADGITDAIYIAQLEPEKVEEEVSEMKFSYKLTELGAGIYKLAEM